MVREHDLRFGVITVDVVTDPALAGPLADLAARTFPLACPPSLSAADVAGFIASNLSAQRFAEHLAHGDRDVLAARDDDALIGYALVLHGDPDRADVRAAVPARPASEVSKLYVDPGFHGGEVASALMDASRHCARDRGSAVLWLGVNQENARAQRFYGKAGFARAGVKTFDVNGVMCSDFVYSRIP